MPGCYEQDVVWVNDLDNSNEDYLLDIVEEFPQLMVSEDEAIDDALMVVEEDDSGMENIIPGSDKLYEDLPQQEDKAKDWENDGDHGRFVDYVKDKLGKIPRHSGETIPGCERAKAFLKSVDNEISKAMRTDLRGVIDEQAIDVLRKSITDMIDRLDKQIKKLQGTKRANLDVRLFSSGQCNKCNTKVPMWHDTASDKMVCMHCEAEVLRDDSDRIEKNAGKPSLNVYMSPFERAIVGIIINATVSGGHNIEEVYNKLKDKYGFNPREELAIQQLIADHGYPIYKDRGNINEQFDPSSSDGVDWLTNYHA